jgi:hypothetical protein
LPQSDPGASPRRRAGGHRPDGPLTGWARGVWLLAELEQRVQNRGLQLLGLVTVAAVTPLSRSCARNSSCRAPNCASFISPRGPSVSSQARTAAVEGRPRPQPRTPALRRRARVGLAPAIPTETQRSTRTRPPSDCGAADHGRLLVPRGEVRYVRHRVPGTAQCRLRHRSERPSHRVLP